MLGSESDISRSVLNALVDIHAPRAIPHFTLHHMCFVPRFFHAIHATQHSTIMN